MSALLLSSLALAGCSSTTAQEISAMASSQQRTSENTRNTPGTDRNPQSGQEDTASGATEEKNSQNNNGTNNGGMQGNKNQDKTAQASQEDENDDVELSGLETVSGNTIDLAAAKSSQLINKGGTYTLKGSGTKTVVVDAKDQDVTLVLDGATIKTNDLPAIYVRNAKKATIEVKGTNTLTTAAHTAQTGLNASLYVRTALDLKGTGTLTITDQEGHGIKAKDDMTSQSVTARITAKKDGIHASDNLTIQNGTYTINASSEGIEAKEELLINDGTFTINSEDDGINAGTKLTVKGGKLTVVSKTNDGLDCNGDLILDGGTITAISLQSPECAFDVDNSKFAINGGTIVGLGTTVTSPTAEAQNTVLINAGKSFSSLELKQGGKTVLTWKNETGANLGSNMILTLSSKDLKADTETELYLDSVKTETFTLEKGLTKVGNIQEMGGMNGMGGRGMVPGMNNGEMPEGELPEDWNGEDRPDFGNGQRPEMSDFENGEMPEFDVERPDFNGERPEFRSDLDNGQSNATNRGRKGMKGSRGSQNGSQDTQDSSRTEKIKSAAGNNGISSSENV